MPSISPSKRLDDSRLPASRRNSVDLRQHAILSTTSRRASWAPDSFQREKITSASSFPWHAEERTDSLVAGQEWYNTIFAPPGRLLNSRRPSLSSLPKSIEHTRGDRNRPEIGTQPLDISTVVEPSSPEDGGNFRRSLQIDMKGLVGDAVGNMSISPASRDVVLAARRGLFIIDLEAPLEVPRFLPQGGTWDVADVQWNPHPSRAEYIVSTSSEKLLIWNLLLVGKTSIEHILQSHYRAITDINWHTYECDTVISTGIDSWLWSWDLREPRKPTSGLCAFKTGGTQVKWNRKDGNILASSHSDEVFIWDRRKGSLPVSKIKAHNSKIYGIDWSHDVRNEIVTCSLDKTIKVWDISESTDSKGFVDPKVSIQMTYPVWRARNLPFGRGLLSLAQRGVTALEMYAHYQSNSPVETFEGHKDVVKEFVWRKGGQDEFQLITWSKDRTLRFWPVDADTMQKVGHVQEPIRGRPRARAEKESTISFRNPPEGTEYLPALSAPVGLRSILAEVRAPLPPRPHLVLQALPGPIDHPSDDENTRHVTGALTKPMHIATLRSQGGTMSRGNNGGKSVARMDALTWLTNVKVGDRRGSSSGPPSGVDSTNVSRLNSRSRPPSGPDRQTGELSRRRSDSQARPTEDKKESEGNQTLQEEITSVLTKLASSKIKLEKHDLMKKRTCTLGLHGPWGESSSVFIRVTFTFPREYPQASHPQGTPTVDLERNPLISMKDRAAMLRRLRAIREQRRPCLESCLRFLLFGNEEEKLGEALPMDSESSSEDEEPSMRRDFTAALLRNNKNLVEPRTSQGTFGPNGELVCFFRAPPRIVRNVLRGLSDSPATPSNDPPQTTEAAPRMFQSPSLISDAVRRLGLSALDRQAKPPNHRKPEDGNNILRIMTNLLTFSQHKVRRDSETKPLGDLLKSYALLAPRRSTVFIASTTNISGGDKKVALQYIFQSRNIADVCETNARVAQEYGRYDHARVFSTLRAIFPTPEQEQSGMRWTFDQLSLQLVMQLYFDFSKAKDVQMLAMMSVLLLQAHHKVKLADAQGERHILQHTPKFTALDYFSLTKNSGDQPNRSASSGWPRPLSPTAPQIPTSLSSSSSSRGSWSSLFNTGTMRQFMTGVQDTLKEGRATPLEITPESSIPTPLTGGMNRISDPPSPVVRRRRPRKDSTMQSPTITSKSWNESLILPPKTSTSFSSAGHRRRTPLAQVTDPGNTARIKRVLVFDPPPSTAKPTQIFSPDLIEQFVSHVQSYAELLFRWELFHKRLELLKSVNKHITSRDGDDRHSIGLVRTCTRCTMILPDRVNACPSCGNPCSMANCTICRLPVKGLSRNCLQCYHVTHISCWNSLDVPICPTGCGCFCNGMDESQTRPSTRLGFPHTPPLTNAYLS
ncbi:hypothetical protein BDZ94DRAFT_1250295 [Collybia nuda]|uniref:WDR59/RTC1-like RING zinc finger domain-containing protein n=1 Tax=Collybia nuda TaxID=64659 RepID=A0A9P6CNI2_9AGAR|nr:hypothetical protein BDZ94DRAFT_1250295 [Collybia nuda]